MKLIISPAGTQHSIVLEGTTEEIESVILNLLQSNPSTVSTVPAPLPELVSTPSVPSNNFHLKNQFLSSIFVYPATNVNNSGRGRYIANILFDGKSHTVNELIAASNATSRSSVLNAVYRMRNAGAEISISNDANESIRLISIPNRRYVKLHPAPKVTTKAQSKTKYSTKKRSITVASALSNFRYS